MMTDRAMIVEHAEIIRKGLSGILYESGLFSEVVELACIAHLTDMIKRHRPAVLIINPAMASGKLREEISDESYRPKIAAIVYGFHDEVLMDGFDEVIIVNDSRSKINKKLSRLRVQPGEPALAEFQLSDREKDVLKLLVRGLSNKEISGQLFISTHTVMSHRKNIVKKLNIKSVAGLTVYAILNGLANMEDLR